MVGGGNADDDMSEGGVKGGKADGDMCEEWWVKGEYYCKQYLYGIHGSKCMALEELALRCLKRRYGVA